MSIIIDSREIDIIKGYYSTQFVTDYSLSKTNNYLYIFDGKNRYIIIDTPHDYPFKPPFVMLQNKETLQKQSMYETYKHFIYFYINKMEDLKSVNNKCCFCCNNLSKHWSPSNRIISMIKECKQIENWFEDIRSGYYGKKILQKKLIKDLVLYIGTYIYETSPKL